MNDAFASGGSAGYDHKKMAITSRGAWESAKRHFRELGIDVQQMPFSVVGIGDMAGDVFGNGMLRSKKIRLVAAFNHQHIFLDPNPDLEVSFAERQRLFDLPRSTWMDYNPQLISQGGGIFDRATKRIPLSKEAKELLNLHQNEIAPDDLIQAILKAQVDMIWFGGIGTFIKASTENHADV
jgi:glutamate dehydrogenase